MADWSKELTGSRELQPSHRRHVRATDKYVFRIALSLAKQTTLETSMIPPSRVFSTKTSFWLPNSFKSTPPFLFLVSPTMTRK
jgi:hypothetical protein